MRSYTITFPLQFNELPAPRMAYPGVIKAVRELTGHSLSEAKAIVDDRDTITVNFDDQQNENGQMDRQLDTLALAGCAVAPVPTHKPAQTLGDLVHVHATRAAQAERSQGVRDHLLAAAKLALEQGDVVKTKSILALVD